MIVLDTNVWIWWTHGDPSLSPKLQSFIESTAPEPIGISAISCWEIATLVDRGRLRLPCATETWLEQALSYPRVELIGLSPEISLESTQLPRPFHQDPADQIIVATARVNNALLVTQDPRIQHYLHVKKVSI